MPGDFNASYGVRPLLAWPPSDLRSEGLTMLCAGRVCRSRYGDKDLRVLSAPPREAVFGAVWWGDLRAEKACALIAAIYGRKNNVGVREWKVELEVDSNNEKFAQQAQTALILNKNITGELVFLGSLELLEVVLDLGAQRWVELQRLLHLVLVMLHQSHQELHQRTLQVNSKEKHN